MGSLGKIDFLISDLLCTSCKEMINTDSAESVTSYIKFDVTVDRPNGIAPLTLTLDVERISWKRKKQGYYYAEALVRVDCPNCEKPREMRRYLDAPVMLLNELGLCRNCNGKLTLNNEEIELVDRGEESHVVVRAEMTCEVCIRSEEHNGELPVRSFDDLLGRTLVLDFSSKHLSVDDKVKISILMRYSEQTLKKLFALCGNKCAFPGCAAPIIDDQHAIVVGEICHIKGRSPNGPRYDTNQTEAERNGYENLLLMCDPHNKIVDHKDTRHKYPEEVLYKFKEVHEARHESSVVREHWNRLFVSHFRNVEGSEILTHNQSGGQNAHQIFNVYPSPQSPALVVEPLAEAWLNPPDHHARLDWYDLRIRVHNGGELVVSDFQVEVAIPINHTNPNENSVLLQHDSQGDTRRYRLRDKPQPVFPGGTSPILMMLTMMVPWNDYKVATADNVTVAVYSGDRCVGKKLFAIDDLLKPDRRKYIRSNQP